MNTLFDSTFVVLGVMAAAAFSPDPVAPVALDIILAACLAIGISTGVSVYEAEHTEGAIRMERLERAMLSSLKDTEVERGILASRYATSFVNFLAPLTVAAIAGTPLLLFEAGIIRDLLHAVFASTALCIALIFGAGYYLGTLAGGRPWRKAVRMALVATATFLLLALIERTT